MAVSDHRCRAQMLALLTAALLCAWAPGPAHAAGPTSALDARAWELVSPAAKNGGEVGAPGSTAAGALQAATAGGDLAYGSAGSFGAAAGAGPVSQYLAGRGAGGWDSQNLTPPQLSGTYPVGVYQLFSADLSRAILSSGWSCRQGEVTCPAANPPLAAGAPSGYRNLYLHEASAYTPLITTSNAPWLSATADEFHLALEGASPDLRHIVIAAEANLYLWSAGTFEQLGTGPGALLAAPSGAISADGRRVYFTQLQDGGLRLYEEGGSTKLVPETVGGGASFQVASADGSPAFFTKGSTLYRYDAAAETSTPLASEVLGVLGASSDGSYLYYRTASGLWLRHEGLATKVAASADASDYPPAAATARVAANGTLVFLSSASLTGAPNPLGMSEAFLYDPTAKKLYCPSCNPRGNTPAGPSSIPAPRGAGGGPPAHSPRALSVDGTRLFFDSADALLLADTDARPDVYEWQAPGAGGCAKAGGCLGLISGGRVGAAFFADASADGSDVFFTTATPLLPADTGAEDSDLYDARAGGGFPEPAPPIPCDGDACQGPPPAPEAQAPGTAGFVGPTNPPVRWPKKICKPRRRAAGRHSCGRERHPSHHRHGNKHRKRGRR